ncbi:MAG: rhomboid family intramembrane serine protease [Bacteroidetes bacterium]|nr:rhomboid family intramembrane serine protease [Bacteroidota bacterium]
MSYYTNYSGYYTPPSSFRFFPKGMKFLLISTTAVWLFQLFLQLGIRFGNVYIYNVFFRLFALYPLGQGFLVWQLVTYLFLHGGFFHIFFNMLALWFFGVELEHVWGTRRFLIYYFLCGIGAGLSNVFLTPLFTVPAPTIGASGAIYGVLIAFGMLFPDAPVFIYFLFPIKAKYFVAIFIAIELFYGVTGTGTGIAHFAHLGGAFVGFVYLMLYRRSIPGTSAFSDFTSRTLANIRGKIQYRRSYSRKNVITDARFTDVGKGSSGRDVRSEKGDVDQSKLDEILDKISASGYDSLTEEEKRVLFNASKKLN